MIENFSLALKLSLLSGIISPILYICIDIIGILSWKGYNYVSQSISDLPGIGSPIRNIMVPLYVICYIFLLFFGLGVFFIDSESRYLQLIGSLITLNAIFSVGGLIFAKYLAEAINSTNNKKNTLVMFFAVLFLVIGIIISIFAFENWLKYGALAIIVLFTVLINNCTNTIPKQSF
jgi:hypothetical protein